MGGATKTIIIIAIVGIIVIALIVAAGIGAYFLFIKARPPGLPTPVPPLVPTPPIAEPEPGPEVLPLVDRARGEEPLSRYPRAVMLSHAKTLLPDNVVVIGIEYGTKDSVDAVVNWYRNMLVKAGWELVMETTEAGETSIAYSKDRNVVGILVRPPSEDVAYTSIAVTYTIGASFGVPYVPS